ncbi:pleckstrin homology domain-containing family J member 1-like [Chrysoperla carnea]|uniref:pleckstrin homology domain-containing family J member 1-like n=1 Tax=Chrysoperla carnea TaxID=189513 RepID=UPI001D08E875|nr:pleckstrin homology domain-containing family J member 1-like [Chrysoperla carnea]
MKFNDRELISVSLQPDSTIEGRLCHQKPQGKDWSDWMSQSTAFKDRWFKLKCNFLFYYRINESENIDYEQPLGVFILETATIQYENLRKVPFGFSISFRDEPDKKHVFSCRSEEDVNRWVAALKASSYEYLRTQLIIIEKKLSMRKGEENVNKTALGAAKQLDWYKKSKGFTCHIEECPKLNPHRIAPSPPINKMSREVNLIEF